MKKRWLYLGLLVWTLGNNGHAARYVPQQTKPSNTMNTRIGLYQLIQDGDQINIVRLNRLHTVRRLKDTILRLFQEYAECISDLCVVVYHQHGRGHILHPPGRGRHIHLRAGAPAPAPASAAQDVQDGTLQMPGILPLYTT